MEKIKLEHEAVYKPEDVILKHEINFFKKIIGSKEEIRIFSQIYFHESKEKPLRIGQQCG